MSRYRPPTAASTALITREGFERLREELNHLWKEKRPEVVKALSAAAAEGDRSENAEYTYRKKQLGEIDRRVRYLSKRLEVLKVVENAPSDPYAIFLVPGLNWSIPRPAKRFATELLAPMKPMPRPVLSASILHSHGPR